MSYPDEVDGTWTTRRVADKPACSCSCHTLMGMKHISACCNALPTGICSDIALDHSCYRPTDHENAHEASDAKGYVYTWWDEPDILDIATGGQAVADLKAEARAWRIEADTLLRDPKYAEARRDLCQRGVDPYPLEIPQDD